MECMSVPRATSQSWPSAFCACRDNSMHPLSAVCLNGAEHSPLNTLSPMHLARALHPRGP